MQFDYRQLYAALLKDWMEVDPQVIDEKVFFGNYIDGQKEDGSFFNPITLTADIVSGRDAFINKRLYLGDPYPNPASGSVKVPYRLNGSMQVDFELYDGHGKLLRKLESGLYQQGEGKLKIELPEGSSVYILKMRGEGFETTKKIITQ